MSKAQDPFATTSDPALYVPRRSTERALEALADAVWHQGGIAVLLGPHGVGKSLLLRVLARRAEDALHCIHVPVPTLDPEGITLWVASRLPGGRRLGGSATLLEVARERPLLLLVEDAELLPGDSARAIAELHRASAGAIRAVLAVNAEVVPENLAEAVEPECVQVTLEEGMNRDEAVEYVTRRLAAAGVPQSVAERFDAGTIAQLHEVSGGNPAKFNVAARAHMPMASRALAPLPPASAARAAPVGRGAVPPRESGLWQDPFPIEPAVIQEAPLPRDHARRRWVWGLSWALGASALTFGVGLLLGLWLRGGNQGIVSPTQSPVSEQVVVSDEVGRIGSRRLDVAIATLDEERLSAGPTPETPSLRAEAVARVEPAPPASTARPAPPLVPADQVSPKPEQEAPRAAAPVLVAAALTGAPGLEPKDPAEAEISEAAIAHEVARREREAVEARSRLFAPELPRERTAELRLDADPPAFVEINGRPFGPTPIRISGLRPGAHRLVAHFQTGETMMREIVLSSGSKELTLHGPLRRAPKPEPAFTASDETAPSAPTAPQPTQ